MKGNLIDTPNLTYKLLTIEQQQRLRALTVFPNTFNQQAAAAVWEVVDANEALITLDLFSNYKIISFDGGENRWHLHDSARLFAAELLSKDDRAYFSQLHAVYFCTVLKEVNRLYLQANKSALTQSLNLYDQECKNILAGQAWAAAKYKHNKQAEKLCLQYPNAGYAMLSKRLPPDEYIRWLEVQLIVAQNLQDIEHEGFALNNLGLTYDKLRDVPKAIKFYEKRLVLAREVGDKNGEAKMLGCLGPLYYEEQAEQGIEVLHQALILNREQGNRKGEAYDLGNLGNMYQDLGQIHTAIEFYEQALSIVRDISDRTGERKILFILGNAYDELGEKWKAITFYQEVLGIISNERNRIGEGRILFNLSLSLDDLGEKKEAIVHAKAALKIHEECNDPNTENVRRVLAEIQS